MRNGITLVVLIGITGCGGASDPAPNPVERDQRAPIALARAPARTGEVLVRGIASPMTHGPYELKGRYTVRFEQTAPEDPRLDFAAATAFAASLTRGTEARPLIEAARRSGRATVTVPAGRWTVSVDFGDYPYALRLTPRK